MGAAPSKVTDTLWLGGQDVLKDAAFFEANNITATLSVCEVTPHPHITQLTRKLHVNVMDVPSADLLKSFEAIATFLHDAQMNGAVTYVHCAAGISRSTTSLVAYIVAVCPGVSVEMALRFLVTRRSIVSPNDGFMQQLELWKASPHVPRLHTTFADRYGDAHRQYSDALTATIEATIAATLAEGSPRS